VKTDWRENTIRKATRGQKRSKKAEEQAGTRPEKKKNEPTYKILKYSEHRVEITPGKKTKMLIELRSAAQKRKDTNRRGPMLKLDEEEILTTRKGLYLVTTLSV